jgi:hypothetical protein
MPELLESVAEKETLPTGTTSEIKGLAQQERDAQERPNLLPNEVSMLELGVGFGGFQRVSFGVHQAGFSMSR